MGEIFGYSLATALPLAVMYLVYKWLMASENQHRCNRALLWAICVLALSLPFIAGGFERLMAVGSEVAGGNVDVIMPMVDFGVDYAKPVWPAVLLGVYMAGVLAVVIMTSGTMFRLWRVISSGEHTRVGRYTLVVTDREDVAPFSWFRYIVMSRRDWAESGEIVRMHEAKHLDAGHWIDLLMVQAIVALQWYNPAAWLMREELKTVHEFQADEAVLSSGANAKEYQMLLIKKAVGARFPSLANSLNHSKLKKRITMMYQSKSPAGRRLRALALVPAAALAVAVANIPAVASVISDASAATLSTPGNKVTEKVAKVQEIDEVRVVAHSSNEGCPPLSADDVYYIDGVKSTREATMKLQPSEIKTITINKNATPTEVLITTAKGAEAAVAVSGQTKAKPVAAKTDKKQREVASAAEVMPKFPGGEAEMMKFLAMNVRYPEAAMKAKTEGRVVVRFVVSETGKVEKPEIIRSVSPELDAEALRVVSEMPDFTPGTVDGKPVACGYTLPVNFALQ